MSTGSGSPISLPGAGGSDVPVVECAFHRGKSGVGERAGMRVEGMGSCVEGAPAVGEASRDDGAEFLCGGGEVAPGVWVGKMREDA